MFKVLIFGFFSAIFFILCFLYKKMRDYFDHYIQNIKNDISSIEKINFNSIDALQKARDEYSSMDNSFLTIYNQKVDDLNRFIDSEKRNIDNEFKEKKMIFERDLKSLIRHKNSEIKENALGKLISLVKNKLK